MDVEQMHIAASKEYKENYSTGEYCHDLQAVNDRATGMADRILGIFN